MDVRLATQADRSGLARTLAAAFDDDPMMGYLLPVGTANRVARLTAFMGLGVKGGLRHDTVHVTDDLAAGAVWRPPGHWKLAPSEMVRDAPALVGALRGRILTAFSALKVIEDAHPSEPHWYLEILGTEPASQGTGLGSAVMAPVLARCDDEGVPAYLESSKESNVPYYERHGFRVVEELALPKGGPSLWRMWREPQPA